jgi:hypothetical protein
MYTTFNNINIIIYLSWMKRQHQTLYHLFHHCRRIFFLILSSTITIKAAAMRIVVQRVKSASVTVNHERISDIGPGIMALVGLHENDTEDNLKDCCRKLLAVKLWENDNGGQWR